MHTRWSQTTHLGPKTNPIILHTVSADGVTCIGSISPEIQPPRCEQARCSRLTRKLELTHSKKFLKMSSSVQTQTTRLTMQFSIVNLKPSLTVSRAKLAHWASELQTTCRVLASTRRMSYLQQFRQFHLDYFNALLVISVYAAMTKQPPALKCSNANSLSFAQSFPNILRSTQMDLRMELEHSVAAVRQLYSLTPV